MLEHVKCDREIYEIHEQKYKYYCKVTYITCIGKTTSLSNILPCQAGKMTAFVLFFVFPMLYMFIYYDYDDKVIHMIFSAFATK